MLQVEKSTTLTGRIEFEGQQAVYLQAQISDNGGNSNISQTITNQSVYDTNKTECRDAIKEFQQKVWSVEDEQVVE